MPPPKQRTVPARQTPGHGHEAAASHQATGRGPQAAAAVGAQSDALNGWHHSPRMVAQRDSLAAMQADGAGGLPSALRQSLEDLAGVPMDGVAVHRNSGRPEQLQARAFAQGNEIHLAPGEEAQLPHEAWHVAQQRQGRVRANGQVDGQPLNDSVALEAEADRMGERASRTAGQPSASAPTTQLRRSPSLAKNAPIQRYQAQGPVEQQRLAALRAEYVALLAGTNVADPGAEFDALAAAAASMAAIEQAVDDLRPAAVGPAVPAAAAAVAPVKANSPPAKAAASSSSSGQSKKKSKPKPMNLGEFFAATPSAPKPAAWGSSKAGVAAVNKPKAPAAASAAVPATVQVWEGGKVSNAMIAAWIEGSAPVSTVSIVHQPDRCTDDTVYYLMILRTPPAIVEGALGKVQYEYTVELHYHPEPVSPNWLHIKHSSQSDPGNQVAPGSGLLKPFAAALAAGRADWEAKTGRQVAAGYRL